MRACVCILVLQDRVLLLKANRSVCHKYPSAKLNENNKNCKQAAASNYTFYHAEFKMLSEIKSNSASSRRDMHVVKYYKAVVYSPFIADQRSGFLGACFFDWFRNSSDYWLIQWTRTAVFVNFIVALTF
jgi:hypothetical protein